MTLATTIEQTLKDKLLATSAITDIVTANVYYPKIPQGQSGAGISYSLVHRERIQSFGKDTGLRRSRFQFSCWGGDRESIEVGKSLAAALIATLSPANGQRYRDLDGTYGVVIQDCMPVTETDSFVESLEAHGVLVDYDIWHRET